MPHIQVIVVWAYAPRSGASLIFLFGMAEPQALTGLALTKTNGTGLRGLSTSEERTEVMQARDLGTAAV